MRHTAKNLAYENCWPEESGRAWHCLELENTRVSLNALEHECHLHIPTDHAGHGLLMDWWRSDVVYADPWSVSFSHPEALAIFNVLNSDQTWTLFFHTSIDSGPPLRIRNWVRVGMFHQAHQMPRVVIVPWSQIPEGAAIPEGAVPGQVNRG